MEPLPRDATDDGRLRPVVVGYDGARSGRRALAWAASEAERRGTRLLVVYAANYPGMKTQLPGEGLLTREPGALDSASAVTDEGIEAVLADHPDLAVSGATEVTGAADALVEASADAALLVVGTRGLPRVVSAVIGSVAYAVTARSACPVVVVKEDGDAARPTGPGRPVVVGTDGSPASDAAVAFAADHAAATGAALEVICASSEDFTATVTEEELEAARAALAERVASELARTHPETDAVVTTPEGQAREVLVEAARTADAGLVVVGSRGRSALGGLVLGSVSQAVIHGARCPVAVISPATAPVPQDQVRPTP